MNIYIVQQYTTAIETKIKTLLIIMVVELL